MSREEIAFAHLVACLLAVMRERPRAELPRWRQARFEFVEERGSRALRVWSSVSLHKPYFLHTEEHAPLIAAAEEFLRIVGLEGAEKAAARAALAAMHVVEAKLGERLAPDGTRETLSKTHLASTAQPRGRWCYAIRRGFVPGGADPGLAAGGCAIYETAEEAFAAWAAS